MQSTWEALGDSAKFRKLPLYALHWDVTEQELALGQVLGAPVGGPLCVLRQNPTNQNQLQVSMFSQTGDLIRTFSPSISDRHGLAKGGAGFLNESVMQLITTNGILTLLDMCTGRERQIGLGKPIALAACCQGRVLCLSSDGFFILVTANAQLQESNISIQQFARENRHLVGITSMSFYFDRSAVTVLVATQDGKVTRIELKASAETVTNQLALVGGDAISRITPSPSGKYWALSNSRGELSILTDGGRLQVALQIDTEAGRAPNQLCWCGEDAIAASFPDLGLLIVGPRGDWIKYTFGAKQSSSAVALVQELDCVRIVTQTTQELLQRVPDVIDSCFRIGSTSPSAMLVDASELVLQGDARANETLRALKQEGELCVAVLDCIRAALAQFDVEDQQLLLRAAAHGKVFLGNNAAERKQCTKAFAKACIGLRVLNVIRHGNIGIPITALQLERSGGMCALALRLARYGHHYLAIKLLQISVSWTKAKHRVAAMQEIARLWAKGQISSTQSVEDPRPVVDKIRRKVTQGFALLAREAFEQSKPELALSLVDLERNLAVRVVTLVEFGELQRALLVVTEHRDVELRAFVMSKFPSAGPLAPSNNTTTALSPLVVRFSAEQTRFLQRGMQTSVTEAVRVALMSATREGDEDRALAIKRDFSVSDIAYWAARVQACIVKKQWKLLERVANQRSQRIGVVVHSCLMHGERDQAVKFCAMIIDEEERAEALGECGEYGAAIDFILSRFAAGTSRHTLALLDIKSKLVLDNKLSAEDKQALLRKM